MRTSPTYKEIHAKVKEIFFADPARYGGGKGPSVKDCHIAHAKELFGVPKKPRTSKRPRVYPCPDNKRLLIHDAFKALGMID